LPAQVVSARTGAPHLQLATSQALERSNAQVLDRKLVLGLENCAAVCLRAVFLFRTANHKQGREIEKDD